MAKHGSKLERDIVLGITAGMDKDLLESCGAQKRMYGILTRTEKVGVPKQSVERCSIILEKTRVFMNTVENRTVLLLGVSRPPTSGFHERPSRVRGYKRLFL